MTDKNLPLVSIIIPCRNEEEFIAKCLDSIIANNYSKDKLEILVIDGMSTDKTRGIITTYTEKHDFIKLLNNRKLHTASAFNIGIRNARGNIIITAGSHTTYSSNYVFTMATYLREYDCVGSVAKTIPSKNTILAEAISTAISNPFGAGNSYMRTGTDRFRLADTASCPGYKKEVFDKIGLFNENLARSQDMEFNLRFRRAGGKIFLAPDITSYYYPKSNFRDFFLHNFGDGVWAIYPLKFVKMPLRLRHYVPLTFVLGLLGTALLGTFFSIFFWLFLFILGVYLLVNFYFSARITIKEKNWRYFFVIPIVFASRHIGYGLGSVWGLVKLLLPEKKQN